MADPNPTPTPAAPAAEPQAAPPPAAPSAAAPARPLAPARRSDSSRCRTPGCTKYHDFFQWNGKYYCLECYEALRIAARGREAAPASK
jgi:hypothetical protein